MRRTSLLTIALLALASCGLPRNVVVLLPDEDGKVGRAVVRGEGGEAELATPLSAVGTSKGYKPGEVFETKRETVERTFAGALSATPRAPKVFIVAFLNGTADVDPLSDQTLKSAVAAAVGTKDADISVVGHSDATGSDSENLALSLQRATKVRDTLVAGGVPSTIIDIAYHGSNNPRIPRPRGVPEPANRRVEVTVR